MNKRKPAAATRAPRRGRTARTGAGTEHKTAFAVAAECTVADAGSLKTGLAKLLEEPEPVTLDVSAVQRVDTAGLQVIAAFVRERESQGRRVQWAGEAAALTNAARLLGLDMLLKLPTAAGQAVETAQ